MAHAGFYPSNNSSKQQQQQQKPGRFYRVPFPLSAQRFISFLCSWIKPERGEGRSLHTEFSKDGCQGRSSSLPGEKIVTLSLLQRIKNMTYLWDPHADNLRVLCDGCKNVQRNDYLVQAANAFLVLYFSPYFFFVCFDYFLLHFSKNFFLHSFLKYLDPLQVFLSMRSHAVWNMGCLCPVADITVHWPRVFLCIQLTPLTQEWVRWPPGVLSNSKRPACLLTPGLESS